MKLFHSIVIFLSLSASAAMADVAVIVHPSNANSLDAVTISRIFTGKMKSFPDGSQAVAINQDAAAGVTDEFNSKVLKKSSSQLKAYWSKLVFTGKGTPPKEVADGTAVIELVATNPNIVGYVDSAIVDSSVKVVGTF